MRGGWVKWWVVVVERAKRVVERMADEDVDSACGDGREVGM